MTQRRSRREEVLADVEHERGLTDAERDERIQAVIRASCAIVATRPDLDRVLAPEPPAPDFAEAWARLVARRRGAR